MAVIGTVESLWRYPVKSMRGEELNEVRATGSGLAGDRLYAFKSTASPAEFPYFTARDQRQMLRYLPRFQTKYGSTIQVETPEEDHLAIDDPRLIERLRRDIDGRHQLTLLRSERALTDSQPVSIISLQTVRKLSEEINQEMDKRRFRANIYIDLTSLGGFGEDSFVGRSLRIGPEVVLAILQRDVRCMMITLDPDTAEKTPALLKNVAQLHEGAAGVYGTVSRGGNLRRGDPVELL